MRHCSATYAGGHDQLKSELDLRVTRDEELIAIMGYLHGDVVKAFRDAIESGRADPANLSAALDAIEAATNTLESHTNP
jgi:hypothetical protein